MSAPFIVSVEFPHDWQDGYTFGVDTLDEAEQEAAELAHGKAGEKGYRKVSILSLVREVN